MFLARTHGVAFVVVRTSFFVHHTTHSSSCTRPLIFQKQIFFRTQGIHCNRRLSTTTARATAAMSETEASGSTGIEQNISEEASKAANDQPGLKGVDTDRELGRLAVNIMPHILNLYNCQATALDFEMYATNGTFEDPLMCAKGVKQIKSAFYSIPKIFTEAKMGEYYVQEDETTSGNGEIRIDNVQHYKIWGRTVDMRSLIKIQVKDGKVIRHEDLWDKNPLWTRNTVRVPLVGRAAEGWRRFNMLITHALMGFGKDPRPKH